MAKKVTTIGLDLSLAKTGAAVTINGLITILPLVKSSPSGDKPINELVRIRKIVSEIKKWVDKYNPDIVLIENLAFMARNTTALTQLAGLSYFTRAMLADKEIPFILCAPTTLKRFITGKGNTEKDHVILSVYKEYGIDFVDNNQADAVVLAKIGAMILGHDKPKAVYQTETIKLLKQQLS